MSKADAHLTSPLDSGQQRPTAPIHVSRTELAVKAVWMIQKHAYQCEMTQITMELLASAVVAYEMEIRVSHRLSIRESRARRTSLISRSMRNAA